jgi:hypothetical protein
MLFEGLVGGRFGKRENNSMFVKKETTIVLLLDKVKILIPRPK